LEQQIVEPDYDCTAEPTMKQKKLTRSQFDAKKRGERSVLSANTRCRRSIKSCALSRKRAVCQRIVDADSIGLEE
jgi:hypothetical protein